MKIKITFWFWTIITSFITSVFLFLVGEIFSTSEYVLFPSWFLGIFPAFTIIGIVFWLRCKFKSSVLTDLFSIATLVVGYCFTTGMAQILAGTIIGFFRSVPIRASIYEIAIGIIGEFQTIFFIIGVWLGRINVPEDGFTFMLPFTILAVGLCFIVLKTFWNFLKFFKKSTTD